MSASIASLVARAAARWPAEPCFVKARDGRPEHVSFGEVARAVGEARAGLAAMGVGPGDRVALIGRESFELAVALVAALERRALIVGDGAAARGAPHVTIDVGDPAAYRALLDAGRGAPVAASSPADDDQVLIASDRATTHAELAALVGDVGARVPFGPDDIVIDAVPWRTPLGLALGLLAPLSRGTLLWPVPDVRTIEASARGFGPSVVVATAEALTALREAIIARVAARGRVGATLFEAKLTAGRRRRELAAAGRSPLWAALERRALDLILPRDFRRVVGDRLALAAVTDAPAPHVTEFFELLGVVVIRL